MLHDAPIFDDFYLAYVKDDPAREPIAVGYSIPGIIATAAEKTGRDRRDFEVQEITAERYEQLRRFLS